MMPALPLGRCGRAKHQGSPATDAARVRANAPRSLAECKRTTSRSSPERPFRGFRGSPTQRMPADHETAEGATKIACRVPEAMRRCRASQGSEASSAQAPGGQQSTSQDHTAEAGGRALSGGVPRHKPWYVPAGAGRAGRGAGGSRHDTAGLASWTGSDSDWAGVPWGFFSPGCALLLRSWLRPACLSRASRP